MYKVYSITVKGKEKTWNFTFWASSDFVQYWLEDGLEINEVDLPVDAGSVLSYIEKFIEAIRNNL